MDNAIRIATWRRARGLTQQEVATDLDVTVSAVSRWESGDASPSQAHLDRLVTHTLRMSMARFYGALPRDAHAAALAARAAVEARPPRKRSDKTAA